MNQEPVTKEMFDKMMDFLVEKFQSIENRFTKIDERFTDERATTAELIHNLCQDMNAQFQEVFTRLDRVESDVAEIKENTVPKHADEIMTLHTIKMNKPEFADH